MGYLRQTLRGAGKQPLLLVIIAVVLIGAVAAVSSYGTPAAQSALSGATKSQTPALGIYTPKDNTVNQSPTNGNIQGQAAQKPSPPATQPTPTPTPTPAPPTIAYPTLCKYPFSGYVPDCYQPPCYSCTPEHVCPLSNSQAIIYPCSPCGYPRGVDIACPIDGSPLQ